MDTNDWCIRVGLAQVCGLLRYFATYGYSSKSVVQFVLWLCHLMFDSAIISGCEVFESD